MKYIFAFIVSISMTCVSLPVDAAVMGQTDKEVRSIAGSILDNILKGMKKDDYTIWSQDFDVVMKESFSEKKFHKTNQQILNQFGEYVCREYLGFLKKGSMTMVLWKSRFDDIADDVLITLVVSKRDDEYKVTGLWFE